MGKNAIPELFGANVFNDRVMKERLPKDAYKAMRQTMDKGLPLKPETAAVVANAMKDWAIEKGATHFTHVFYPLTGLTAEKHDAFLNFDEGTSLMKSLEYNENNKQNPSAINARAAAMAAPRPARMSPFVSLGVPSGFPGGLVSLPR